MYITERVNIVRSIYISACITQESTNEWYKFGLLIKTCIKRMVKCSGANLSSIWLAKLIGKPACLWCKAEGWTRSHVHWWSWWEKNKRDLVHPCHSRVLKVPTFLFILIWRWQLNYKPYNRIHNRLKDIVIARNWVDKNIYLRSFAW